MDPEDRREQRVVVVGAVELDDAIGVIERRVRELAVRVVVEIAGHERDQVTEVVREPHSLDRKRSVALEEQDVLGHVATSAVADCEDATITTIAPRITEYRIASPSSAALKP